MTRSFQRAQNHVKTRSVEKVRRRNTEKVRRSKTVLILSHYRIFGPVGKSKIESCLPENRQSDFRTRRKIESCLLENRIFGPWELQN
jgi:hypothetical protein